MSDFHDVGKFHNKFGLYSSSHDGAGPQPFDIDLMRFRVLFMLEELQEFMEGAGFKLIGDEWGNLTLIQLEGVEPNHPEMFDALIDLVYVAHGTAHLNGYPWLAGWKLVQEANMQKVRAAKDGSDSKRGSSFDVVKPEGWTAPDIAGLLESFGWPIKKESN